MENLLLIVLIFLIIILLVLIIILSIFALRMIKANENKIIPKVKEVTSPPKNISPELLKSLRSKKEEKRNFYCTDHESEVSAGNCALSGLPFCEHCLTTFNNMKFAKKYLNIYLESSWPELIRVAENSRNTSLIERIYKVKKELWDAEELPIIVQGQYKINIDDDGIESFVVIHAREEDSNLIREKLSFLKYMENDE